MDFLQIVKALGMAGGGGGRPPLAGLIDGKSGAGLSGPLAALAGAGGPTASQAAMVGPVGGPRAIPQPLETFDPGPSSAAEPAMPAAPPPSFGNQGNGSRNVWGDVPVEAAANTAPLAIGSPGPELGGPLPDPASMRKRGPLGAIGDFIGSDDGKAALFRAGATMLGGGSIGDGMMAGAHLMDTRKGERTAAEKYEREFGLKERGVDIDQQQADTDTIYKGHQAEMGALDRQIDIATLQEAQRKNMAGEALTEREHAMLQQWRSVQANLTQRGQDITRRGQDVSAETTRRGQDLSHDASIYSADAGIYNNAARIAAPDDGYDQTSTVIENDDGSKTTTTSRTPQNVVRVTSQAQYQALPPGTRYVDANGTPGVK